MPIAQLAPDTVCVLGSTQVLVDPCSVVKELVENSLDARASAIFVELSLNALDVIQVRDNGYGILPDDRALLASRHCTSKLRNLDDLSCIGGTSLGFRGEALASAAEMSGSMIVSTRIESEATAVSLTFGRQGEIKREERVSLPIGTTVRLVDFLKPLPIRRQTTAKESAKVLSNVKRLLYAYAFSRPTVKFSLKVLKAKSEKTNWIYAPRSGDDVPEAAIKVVGKKLVDQCSWKVWSSSLEDESELSPSSTIADHPIRTHYTIRALLLKSDYDPVAGNNAGQYVSVDFRPVSCNRGTLKHIVGLYKSYLKSSGSTTSKDYVKDPFLSMNIMCPPGSYDVNIEPAKDDVLFSSPQLLMEIVTKFFRGIYGEIPEKPLKNSTTGPSGKDFRPFNVLLAKRAGFPPPACNSSDSTSCISAISCSSGGPSQSEALDRGTQDNKGKKTISAAQDVVPGSDKASCQDVSIDQAQDWAANMSDEDGVESFISPGECRARSSIEIDEDQEDLQNVNVSNPWIFAKINAVMRRNEGRRTAATGAESSLQLLTPAREEIGSFELLSSPQDMRLQHSSHAASNNPPTPPTPHETQTAAATSSLSFDSSLSPYPFPRRAWAKGDAKITAKKSSMIPQNANDKDGIAVRSSLDKWLQNTPDKPQTLSLNSQPDVSSRDYGTSILTGCRDFVSARALPLENNSARTGTIPNAIAQPKSKFVSESSHAAASTRPFKPLTVDGRHLRNESRSKKQCFGTVAIDTGNIRDTTIPATLVHPSCHDLDAPTTAGVVEDDVTTHPDLASAMDYEIRKQAAMLQYKNSQRQTLRARRSSPPSADDVFHNRSRTSPHNNRYMRAVAALHSEPEKASTSLLPGLEAGDPREYLIRTQQRDATATTNRSPSRHPKRIKTGLLPLETTQEGDSVRDLIQHIDRRAIGLDQQIRALFGTLEFHDEYISRGHFGTGFAPDSFTMERVQSYETKLRHLLRHWHTESGDSQDIQIDLWTTLQEHFAKTPDHHLSAPSLPA